MKEKIKVAIVFGGRSGEHTISCATAAGVLKAIDRERFEPVPIGITPEGEWVLVDDDPASLEMENGQGATVHSEGTTVGLLAGDPVELVSRTRDGKLSVVTPIDVVLPLLHGPFGEDGTIQGYFETIGVRYAGCGVLASALGMDKAMAKVVLAKAGLPVGDYRVITDRLWSKAPEKALDSLKDLHFPVFVKPARAGSSLGVTRVDSYGPALSEAIHEARQHDPKVIVEAGIKGREIECAVLASQPGEAPRVAPPGEIGLAKDAVYDFDSKYVNQSVTLKAPADLPAAAARRIQELALRAFLALECEGLARVDFFYDEETDRAYVNEINTMPGMTPVSLYPTMWATAGMSYTQLVTELIESALARPLGLH